MDKTIAIGKDFRHVSLSEWKESVDKMIQADSNEKLLFKSVEQINLTPLDTESIKTLELSSFPKTVKLISNKVDLKKNHIIDLVSIHNAGASIIQELKYAFDLFTKKITKHNLVEVHLCCDSLYFSNIAKLRALRFCLERICEENNKDYDFKIIAHHSLRDQTLYDPWVNMIRSTSSSMAALIGGADQVSALGYDALFSQLSQTAPSQMGQRQATNMLKILIEESHLDWVKDPSKGSYTVDNLTYQFVDKSWKEFSEGLDLKNFPNEVKQIAQKRYELIRKRKISITGINNFANPEETMQSIYKNDLTYPKQSEDFPIRSISKEFDQLRLKVEKKDIKMQVAVYGDGAKLSGRVNFCKNYFEIIGAKVIESPASTDSQALLNHCKENDLDYVILCAQDKDYEQCIKELVSKYKKEGKEIFFMAGKNPEIKDNDIFEQIYMGQDVYSVLDKFVQEVLK